MKSSLFPYTTKNHQQSQIELNFSAKPTEQIFSVFEISTKIKQMVESNFAHVSIKGEISGLKKHTSGHYYFALKDQDAVIDAVCWRGTPLKIQLEDGLEVIVKGRITTYPGRSKYQIIVEQAEIAGEGALLKLLFERKAKLEAEGLFARKRPLPQFPRCIGVITSPTGAVIRDILHRISDRFPCHVIVWPVLVQGPGAAEQIAEAIDGFNNDPNMIKPDLLIVARGGGSMEDLWAFNEEIVVRAAAKSQIPLISAIGHETDTTLIDFASDMRAPTPTAAAELATPLREKVLLGLLQYGLTLHNRIHRYIELKQVHLRALEKSLPDAQSIFEHACLRFDDWSERLKLTHVIQKAYHDFEQRWLRLNQSYHLTLREYHHTFTLLAQRLELVSYQRSLERGFCYIECNHQSITNKEAFKKTLGHKQSIHFHDGHVDIVAEEDTSVL